MFNTRGEREDSLTRSALEMIAAFEDLLAFLVQPAASAVRHELPPFTEKYTLSVVEGVLSVETVSKTVCHETTSFCLLTEDVPRFAR